MTTNDLFPDGLTAVVRSLNTSAATTAGTDGLITDDTVGELLTGPG
ncbi:hypothetical protein [Actinomadura sp. KC06]|nr:hypothetical protein [Actinomadura sp. KC06]